MTDHTTYDQFKSDESVQVYWRSYMVHVSSKESDFDETGCPSWHDFAIFKGHRPDTVIFHILLSPLDLASQLPPCASIFQNLRRLLAEFGFRHHHVQRVNEEGLERR